MAPLAAASVYRSSKWSVGQTVLKISGPVEGHAASVAKQVSEYLDIPYALPPVGELRFRSPVRYTLHRVEQDHCQELCKSRHHSPLLGAS